LKKFYQAGIEPATSRQFLAYQIKSLSSKKESNTPTQTIFGNSRFRTPPPFFPF